MTEDNNSPTQLWFDIKFSIKIFSDIKANVISMVKEFCLKLIHLFAVEFNFTCINNAVEKNFALQQYCHVKICSTITIYDE